MGKTLHQKISIEDTWREVRSNNLILDERSFSPTVAHVLSVLSLSQSSGFEPPVLWLDGNNSFNPYRISEVSRTLGLDSERVLHQIYISRAFTCYQMKSLIIEKLENAVEKYGSSLVVITGLPGSFSRSDLSEKEALQVFDPVVETLKSFKKSGPTLFLSSPNTGGENRFSSKLRSISDRVIGYNPEKTRSANGSRVSSALQRKTESSGSAAGTRSLEEFA